MENNCPAPINRSLALLASLVYFVQGALGISAVALPMFLRQRGWTVSEIATFSFVEGLPWTLKVIYGAISDGIPIGGLRRKPYVILASLVSAAGWIGLAVWGKGSGAIYFFGALASLGFAVTDVVTDAWIVENSTNETSQIYQSLAWGFRSLGAVGGGVAGGWLAENFPHRLIFAGTTLLPVLTLLAGCLIREPRGRKEGNVLNPVSAVMESLKSIMGKDLRWFCLFLVVVNAPTSFGTPFFFHLKENLVFSESLLGGLSSLTWIGAVAGCFAYGRFFKDWPLQRALFLAVGLSAVNTLLTFGVVGRTSAFSLSVLGGFLGYVSLLPVMASASVLSRRPGIEGSLFALVMSVHNLSQILWTYVGGKLFDIIGLTALIGGSTFIVITGIFFVRRIQVLRG